MRAPRDAQDKLLFTPGPLTTSRTVKQAALRDLDSRDYQFIALVRDLRRRLVTGMRALGFVEYLPRELQGHIITSFRYPENPRWDFDAFYALLNEEGYVIYPGKVGDAPCFRIGSIGRIFPDDVRDLLAAIQRALKHLGIPNTNNALT